MNTIILLCVQGSYRSRAHSQQKVPRQEGSLGGPDSRPSRRVETRKCWDRMSGSQNKVSTDSYKVSTIHLTLEF